MSNKATHSEWVQGKKLSNHGFDADPKRVRIHANESPKHVCVRFLCAYVLQQAGRSWDVECTVNESGDRVDVLDFGDFDEEPLAIEIESSPDRKTLESKVNRYVTNGPCRDVLPLDLRECPDSIDQIIEWLQTEIPGV